MLDRDRVAELLDLHARAYQLLLWLSDQATRDPAALSPAVLAALREPATAAEWLRAHRARLPEQLLPPDECEAFATLLASFFATSFDVKHLEFDGQLVESRVHVHAGRQATGEGGLEHCQVLALRHLAAAEHTPITEKDARHLLRRKTLREASFLWTYAWELDHRARGKGKGAVVHRLWRSLPKDTRKSLDADRVWAVRQELLQAIRHHCNPSPP